MSEIIKDYSGRDYRTVWQHPRAQFEDEFEGGIIKKLVSHEPGWFIDLGGGYGRLVPLYTKKGRNIVIVDYAPNLLEMAAETYASRDDVHLIAANAYHLPFKDSTFSAGISIRTFHHMNAPERFLGELSRVMRPQTHALIEYSNKRNLMRVLKKWNKSMQVDHEEYMDLQYGTHPRYFSQIAERVGLEVARNLGTGFLPRFLTEKTLSFKPLFSIIETLLDGLYGPLGLAPMNFSDLKKTREWSAKDTPPGTTLLEILACPVCKQGLTDHQSHMACSSCGKQFEKRGKIVDFRHVEN